MSAAQTSNGPIMDQRSNFFSSAMMSIFVSSHSLSDQLGSVLSNSKNFLLFALRRPSTVYVVLGKSYINGCDVISRNSNAK